MGDVEFACDLLIRKCNVRIPRGLLSEATQHSVCYLKGQRPL